MGKIYKLSGSTLRERKAIIDGFAKESAAFRELQVKVKSDLKAAYEKAVKQLVDGGKFVKAYRLRMKKLVVAAETEFESDTPWTTRVSVDPDNLRILTKDLVEEIAGDIETAIDDMETIEVDPDEVLDALSGAPDEYENEDE